jgi:hypothetical protein
MSMILWLATRILLLSIHQLSFNPLIIQLIQFKTIKQGLQLHIALRTLHMVALFITTLGIAITITTDTATTLGTAITETFITTVDTDTSKNVFS